MQMLFKSNDIPYQNCQLDDCSITVKRIDKVHDTISGNKFYKLKYNLIHAKEQGYSQIISFGGAYSNHIYALAHACHEYGFDSIGVIRGDELASKPLNPTLQTASNLGMQFDFISRPDYRNKDSTESITKLQEKYPNAYIIPEGGSNKLAVKGCEEILSDADKQIFDLIVLAVGTGGTMSGIINAVNNYSYPDSNHNIANESSINQQVIGFSALNSDYQRDGISQFIITEKDNWQLFKDDFFGGYGRYGHYQNELCSFIESIKQDFGVPLEPIYTAKALYRLKQMIASKLISRDKKILFIHTGGLQAFTDL